MASLVAVSSDKSKSDEQLAVLQAELDSTKKELSDAKNKAEQTSASATTELQKELEAKTKELASTKDSLDQLQQKNSDIQTSLADKDGDIAKLKTMHDERMKQLSQDYENEIESLRGDAFFKRKYQELEGQHEALQASSTELEQQHAALKASSAEAAETYAKELAAAKNAARRCCRLYREQEHRAPEGA